MSISSVIWLSITYRVCLSNMYEVCLSITYGVCLSIMYEVCLSFTYEVCLSTMKEVSLSIKYEVLYNYFIERGCISVHNVPDLLLMILTLLIVYL